MKRLFVWATVVLVVLASCQGAGAKPELTVLSYADPADQDRAGLWDGVRAGLKGELTVKVEELTGDAYDQRIVQILAGAPVPDLVFLWPSGRSAVLHSRRLVKDLTPLLGDQFLKDFAPAILSPGTQTGGFLAEVPGSLVLTHVWYVNTSVLDRLGLKPATTYEELRSQVPRIKAAGLEVVLMANQDGGSLATSLLSMVVGRLCAPGFVDQVVAGRARVTDPAFVAALAFIQTLWADGVLSKSTLITGYGDIPALFATGQAPYFIDGDWRVGAFLTDPSTQSALLGPQEQGKIVLSAFPSIPGQAPGAPDTSVIVGAGFGVSAALEPGSPRERAAVAVLKALETREVQASRLSTSGTVPSRIDVAGDRLEPLARARLGLVARVTGSPALEARWPPSVIARLGLGLRDLGLGTRSPEAVAAEVQDAWDAEKPAPSEPPSPTGS